jgi:hypothetical protein
MGSCLSRPFSIEFPKTIIYQNTQLAITRHGLRFFAFLFVVYLLIWERNFMEDAIPFGAITFSAPGSYTVDTSTKSYCSSSAVDDCTILEPTEALLGSSTEGTLFVNTKVTYTSEVCTSCSTSGKSWVTQPTSATTSSLYTVNETSTYFVAGVEDYEVYVQHGGMVKWGYGEDSEYYGTAKTMTGALLGSAGNSVEKTFKSTNAYDIIKVSELLSAVDNSMCTAATCDTSDARYTGGTILVELRYKNRISHMTPEINEDMDYYYHCTLLPSLEDNTMTDIYPDLSGNYPYGKARMKLERSGFTVVFKITGAIGKFSFSVGWVHFVAGCFMFIVADWVFQLVMMFVCSETLRHKISVAKQASTDVFIYSSVAHRQKDGTYDHTPAKAMLSPEVELSEYQKKKHVQRQISRTRNDNNDAAAEKAFDELGRPPLFNEVGGDNDGWEAGGGGGHNNTRKPVPIGTKIKREFPGYGFFEGTVVEYKKPFYRVVYPDGDSEQLLGKELRPLILAQYL